ncbi:MAG: hypothetical protein SFU86_13055 [Pirellulaceae bacterium]|nr:hypothetical protein [Pirellulaceae bacterium]
MSSTDSTPLPDCIMRDNLTSPYFPNTSKAGLSVVIALCAIFALTSFNRLNHTDLWGHVNFGQWMVEHRALPAADPFAAEPSAAPMLHSAWLAQVLGYLVHAAFGNEGLAFGHALLVTATAGVLMLAASKRGIPATWAWSAGAIFFVLDLPILGTIRPQLFGQLGAALVLLACSILPAKKHPLVWLPMVAALWANLHGSILMGIAILGAYAIGTTWNLFVEHGRQLPAMLKDGRFVTIWLALALLVAGACVGPHGPMLLVRTIFFGEHAALSSISEWRALTPTSLTGLLMIASGAAALGIAKTSPKKWELHEILILAAFGLATVSAIRMLAWWSVAFAWVILPHAVAAWAKYRQENNLPEPVADEPASMRTVLALGVVFMTALLAPPTYAAITGKARGEGPITVVDTPIYVADDIVRRGLAGPIAAPMDWADYLVFRTDGQLRPLVYSHVHLTERDTWKDYESIFRGDELWMHVLQNHKMRYLLVSRQRYPQLARLVTYENLSDSPRLRVLYQDQRCVLAELSQAKRKPSQPSTTPAAPAATIEPAIIPTATPATGR